MTIKKGNREIAIKPLCLTVFIIFDPQILVKGHASLQVCILATRNKYPMLFHSILNQACFMSLFTLSLRGGWKKQRPVLKPLKRFTPTLWQCAAWLLLQI